MKVDETVTQDTEPALRAAPTPQQPTLIDRFRVLDTLGAGGMGVVYEAHDPQLDRHVALKVVRASSANPSAQANLVREAQAMAKLQHPNVVAVYDVGIYENQVFVAMELVDGVTLRGWLAAARRPWREIARVFLGASRGLAAAHAAGLVHRDFKPDNVLIASDGTARLADFGLARPVDDQSPAAAGTLAYMAPEQHDNAEVSEAADQFAFAAALWEAVFGLQPFAGDTAEALAEAKRAGRLVEPPRGRAAGWLVATLRRALSPAAADRYPSLAALGRALERGLARRRRAVVASVALTVAAAMFAGGVLASPDATERCVGSDAVLAVAWNPAARLQLLAHLAELGPYAVREAPRITGELSRYGERWIASHHATCKASVHAEITPQVYERNLACLERARSALGAAVDVMTRVPEDRLGDALKAAQTLPDPEACRAGALESRVASARFLAPVADAIANNLERIRVRAYAGEPDAPDEAALWVAVAEQLGYQPLIARGKLVQGLAWLTQNDLAHAFPLLDDAAKLALRADDDAMFVEAYAREVFAVTAIDQSKLPAHARDVLGAIPFTVQIALRLGPAAAFERPLLFNSIGVYYRTVNDETAARQWLLRAADEPLTAAGHPELSAAYANLVFVTDSAAERARLMATRIANLERAFGADHIQTLNARFVRGLSLRDPGAAAEDIAKACDRLLALHSRSAQEIIYNCSHELVYLALERDDVAQARAYFAPVTSYGGDRAMIAQAYFDLVDGKLDRAASIADNFRGQLGAEPWVRSTAADAMLVAARAEVRRGRLDVASSELAAALASLEPVAGKEPPYERRVARLHAELAALLQRRDPAAARAHATAALSWYRSAGGYDATVRALEAIVTGSP